MNTALAPLIDHTLLRADAAELDVLRLCREAIGCGFAAVCVHPCRLEPAKAALAGSRVKLCTVAGFPLGASTTAVKQFEAADAVCRGADEVDMVLAIGALKDRRFDAVREDIRAVAGVLGGRVLKVIIETALLSDEEKRVACLLAVEAGAQFVKTCTGFAGGGATVADIRLMRSAVGPGFGVKASGGIRTLADALALVEAGANRLGTSAGVAIAAGSAPASGAPARP